MTYEVIFPTRTFEELVDSTFADFESAIGYAIWAIDTFPSLRRGWRDIAVIREFMSDAPPIVSGIRVDDDFFLAKDTNDPKYLAELLSVESKILTTPDRIDYTVYRYWPAVDA